jgi:redox-sensing transcriptional repressor
VSTAGTTDATSASGTTSATGARPLPPATVARLPAYREVLLDAASAGRRVMSSGELAARLDLHPDQVRKDLSHLATRGTRGLGYDVTALVEETSRILGLTEERGVVLVGAGNLGRALAAYEGFSPRGFRLVAIVDVDPDVVGTTVGGLVVAHLDLLPRLARRLDVAMGVVTVPAAAAQQVVDRLVAVGITAVLNFAPVHLRVPAHVAVRRVDLSTELQMLSFHRASTSTEVDATTDTSSRTTATRATA